MTDHDAQLGYDAVPDRYAGERETIDKIRDVLGDYGFRAYCLGALIKYTERAGRKGPESVDLGKGHWYSAMLSHMAGDGPDPRERYRSGFRSYQRPEGEPGVYRAPRPWLEVLGGVMLGQTFGASLLALAWGAWTLWGAL